MLAIESIRPKRCREPSARGDADLRVHTTWWSMQIADTRGQTVAGDDMEFVVALAPSCAHSADQQLRCWEDQRLSIRDGLWGASTGIGHWQSFAERVDPEKLPV